MYQLDQDAFDTRIQDLIRMFEYPVYLIHPDKKINCTCQNFDTKQGNPKCKTCLGTGKKITIQIIQAAVQPCIVSDSEYHKEAGRIYYTRTEYPVKKYDIIVDHMHVDVVQTAKRFQTDDKGVIYYQIYTAPKEFNRELFRNHFYEIIRSSPNADP